MDDLAQLLSDRLGGLSVRRMFGGWGLFREDTMIGLVYDGTVYAKTTDDTRPRFEAAGMRPFNPRPDQTFPTYWSVPPEAVDDADDLRRWFLP